MTIARRLLCVLVCGSLGSPCFAMDEAPEGLPMEGEAPRVEVLPADLLAPQVPAQVIPNPEGLSAALPPELPSVFQARSAVETDRAALSRERRAVEKAPVAAVRRASRSAPAQLGALERGAEQAQAALSEGAEVEGARNEAGAAWEGGEAEPTAGGRLNRVSTEKAGEIRNRLFEDGQVRPEMKNIAGYKLYADRYTKGHMQPAFVNVSAVLSPSEFASLEWGKQFHGTTSEYRRYRLLLVLENGRFNPEAEGEDGLATLAWSLVERSGVRTKDEAAYAKVRRNLRAVLNDAEIAAMKWPVRRKK